MTGDWRCAAEQAADQAARDAGANLTDAGIAAAAAYARVENESMSDTYIRRAAQRRGLRVWKSKLRDPNAEHYGMWWVCRVADGVLLGPIERLQLVRYIRSHELLTHDLDMAVTEQDPSDTE